MKPRISSGAVAGGVLARGGALSRAWRGARDRIVHSVKPMESGLKCLYPEYKDRPVEFAQDILGIDTWGKEESRTGHEGQEGMLQAMSEFDIVLLQGGRGVTKTSSLAMIFHWWLQTAEDRVVITTAPKFEQMKNQLWREIRGCAARSAQPLLGECLTTEYTIGELWFGLAQGAKDGGNFRGYHARGGVLFIGDEANDIPEEMFDVADGFSTQPGCKIALSSNPVRRAGRYFQWCKKPPRGAKVIKMSSYDAPKHIVTDRWLEDRKEQYGPDHENNPRWSYNVAGDFPMEAEKTLIPFHLLERNKEMRPKFGGRHIGLDVARMGGDRCVALLLDNGLVRAKHVWGKKTTMQTASIAMNCAKKWEVPPENVHIDLVGVGGGVVDRLREIYGPVDGVDVGTGPVGDWRGLTGRSLKFKNRRAELFWVLRLLMEEGSLAIPDTRNYTGLWDELQAIEYRYPERDLLQLVPKDETKKILGRSPDEADALALALSRAGVSSTRVGRAKRRAA